MTLFNRRPSYIRSEVIDDYNMSAEFPVPETRVLAIASHVVYGYVGNTMATFVLQALGCDVAALNTVHFSNHTGYRQWKGTKTPVKEINEIYEGLKQSYLTDFDVLLSGYAPSAEAVEAIGMIGRDLRTRATMKPGSFFWILDPVMGDQGKLYVSESVVPAYKEILRGADLILPNQFEAEQLSGITISSPSSIRTAISTLHKIYSIPHIIITSVSLGSDSAHLSIIGSSATSDHHPRLFSITVPQLSTFFSGTGDMFASLILVRLREAALAAGLGDTKAWMSPDNVEDPTELPLAKACEKVLSSMQMVLEKTAEARERVMKEYEGEEGGKMGSVGSGVDGVEGQDSKDKKRYLTETRAAEVRIVRNVDFLKHPEKRYKAQNVDV